MPMKTKDIVERAELPSKGNFAEAAPKVFAAFLEGHIITIGGTDYRYAKKDTPLFEDDENIYVATASAFYQRYNSYTGGETEPSGFRWIERSGSVFYFLTLFETMTEDEVMIVLGNRALTAINTEGSRTRRISASRENQTNKPQSL